MSRYYPPPSPFVGGRQPLEPGKLPPSITAVPVNDPPLGYRPWLTTAIGAWEPPFISAQGWRALVQGVVVAADQPPLGYRPWLAATLEQWQPPFIAAQGWQYIVQGTVFIPDTPPLGYRPWLSQVVSAWEPPPPQPWPGWKLNPVFEAVAVDAPPPWRAQWPDQVRATWEPPWTPAQRAAFAVQGAPIVVDNPPPLKALWLDTVMRAWQPAPVTPPELLGVIVEGVTPPPTPPPVSADVIRNFSLREWRQWHRPQDEQELRRRGISPAAAEAVLDVATRQAAEPKDSRLDEQQRIDELRGELRLRGLELESKHLEALNAEREALIDAEITATLRLVMDNNNRLILLLIASI